MPVVELPDDPISQDEIGRERVRVLLDRYGVIFRELLQKELPELRWPAIFRSLRLMELSGEVIAGQFFQDIPGMQFTSPRALEMLKKGMPKEATFWFNATDPASLCGAGLEKLKGILPSRIASTFLVYQAHRPILIAKRNCRDLHFLIQPEPDLFADTVPFFHYFHNRSIEPIHRLVIDTINKEKATDSPFIHLFNDHFEVSNTMQSVSIFKKR